MQHNGLSKLETKPSTTRAQVGSGRQLMSNYQSSQMVLKKDNSKNIFTENTSPRDNAQGQNTREISSNRNRPIIRRN